MSHAVISKSIPCKQNSQNANSLWFFEHPNTIHADKQNRYTPTPQTKSTEGSEFGQQYNYLFQSENNELKPKYKLNNVYKIHVIVATYIFETPFFISNNYFHYKISFVYLG